MKIGVTGGIGSGKSLVVDELEKLGAKVYRADQRAKELVHKPEIRKKIEELIGSRAFENDSYNTRYVASIVFQDALKLQALNAIIHPAVFADLDLFCNQNRDAVIVYESALMMETGHTHLFDKVILVSAPIEVRIMRVMKRDGISREAVMQRMEKQWSDKKREGKADIIIENVDREKTIEMVHRLWESKFSLVN